VRCYVGDAMVFRTLGDVDNALAAVEETETERVLKTIESFAVECSINKVWTSEALAFVVDEALQVYGGYGYSQEFPAERAYRDARITRIYEGTNEINRLIISTRLLRNENLFQFVASDDDVAFQENRSSVFGAERSRLSFAKRLVIQALSRAQAKFGEGLSNQQEVLAHISDIIIEIYALESAILRTEKLIGVRKEEDCATPIDVTRVYASDAADRMMHSTKQVASALVDGETDNLFSRAMQRFISQPSINIIAAKRRIADAVIKAGRYYL